MVVTHMVGVWDMNPSQQGANVCLEMANVVRAAGQQAAPGTNHQLGVSIVMGVPQ